MDSDYRFFGCRVDGLKCFAINSSNELIVDESTFGKVSLVIAPESGKIEIRAAVLQTA
jgi:hypothetical protein